MAASLCSSTLCSVNTDADMPPDIIINNYGTGIGSLSTSLLLSNRILMCEYYRLFPLVFIAPPSICHHSFLLGGCESEFANPSKLALGGADTLAGRGGYFPSPPQRPLGLYRQTFLLSKCRVCQQIKFRREKEITSSAAKLRELLREEWPS